MIEMQLDLWTAQQRRQAADFDGATYEPPLDRERLTGQLRRVYELMRDARWRTLTEIREVAGGSEAACSARLRDLRKARFGGHTVERRRRGDGRAGLFEYRLASGGES